MVPEVWRKRWPVARSLFRFFLCHSMAGGKSRRLKEAIVGTKAMFALPIAALLIATSSPAMAKQETTKATQKQTKRAGKDCVTTAPPFMRNPRFMNRGFFKKKCKTK